MTTDIEPTRPSAPRAPRWMLWLLFASLALNLLIIGLVAGSAWRFRHGGGPPHHGWAPPNLIGYSMALERGRNKALREATSPMRHALKPLRRDIHAARNEVTAAISAEPFDQARFDAAQARLVDLENQARQQTLALYAEIAKSLTPDERRAYKQWRERRRPPAPGFFDDLEGPGQDPGAGMGPGGKGPMR